MPSDFNQPLLTTAYAAFLQTLKDRDVDSITQCLGDPSNKPTGAFRYLRASNKFQEWDGSAWQDKVISVAGGGTGATSIGGVRTALGLGTMAVQNDNAVAINGGTINSCNSPGAYNLNASYLAAGTVAAARLGSGTANASTFLRGDSTWQTVVTDIPYGPDQGGIFTAVVGNIYNLVGSAYLGMPSVVGNGGRRIGFVNKGGSPWTIYLTGGETILGQNPWSFDFGQYSSVMLIADANGGKWDIF